MAQGGTVNTYLSVHQMKALDKIVEKKGVSRAQVAKELVVRGLVQEGLLEQLHLDAVLNRQFGMYLDPHGNAGEDLVMRSHVGKAIAERREEQEPSPAPMTTAEKRAARRKRRMAR